MALVTNVSDLGPTGIPANTTPSTQVADLTLFTGVDGGKTNGDR